MNENIEAWTGFFSYKPTKVLQWLLNSPCKITCLYCVGADEYIYTDSGAKLAGELIEGDKLYNGNEVVSNEILEDELYEVTFSTGIKLKCNAEHPLYWREYKHTQCGESFKSVSDIAKKEGTS